MKRLSAALLALLLTAGSICTPLDNEFNVYAQEAPMSESEGAEETPAISELDAVPYEDSVKLSWNKSGENVCAEVYMSLNGGEYQLIAGNAVNGELTVLDLQSGSDYTFKVVPYIENESGKVYGEEQIIKTGTLTEEVKGLAVKDVTSTGYTLSWGKVGGAESYKVYKLNTKNSKYVLFKTVKSNSLSVKGLSAGSVSRYKVTAVKNIDGELNETEGAQISCATSPAQTKNIKTKTNMNRVYVSWNKTAGASGYEVYCKGSKSKNYVRVKTVTKNNLTVTRFANGKINIMIRAYKLLNGKKIYGKFSGVKTARVFTNKSYRQILNYATGKSQLKVSSGYGYKISKAKANRLTNALRSYGDNAGMVMLDLESGAMVSYNARHYFPTASTAKMPWMLYGLTTMDKKNISINEKVTFLESDRHTGSGVIQYQPAGGKYTIGHLLHNILYYSDNTAYYMFQRRFGYFNNYNKFIASLGCRPSQSFANRWGYVSAKDSAMEWSEMYKYLRTGKYRSFMKKEFKRSIQSNVRIGLGGKYTVYSKSGWTEGACHDTTVVMAKHPYVLVCFTNGAPNAKTQAVARAAESVHNEYWQYIAKKK